MGWGRDQSALFVKLVSEISVDQQTRTQDRTFEGVPDPDCPVPIGASGAATPIFGPFLAQLYQIT